MKPLTREELHAHPWKEIVEALPERLRVTLEFLFDQVEHIKDSKKK